jgi:hypothetical protein
MNAEENTMGDKVKLEVMCTSVCAKRLASLKELHSANIDLAHEWVSMSAEFIRLLIRTDHITFKHSYFDVWLHPSVLVSILTSITFGSFIRLIISFHCLLDSSSLILLHILFTTLFNIHFNLFLHLFSFITLLKIHFDSFLHLFPFIALYKIHFH